MRGNRPPRSGEPIRKTMTRAPSPPGADDRIRLVERRVPPDLDRDLIARLVYGFYDRVRADPVLAPVFDAAIAADAWPAHLERMCAFWSSVALGAGGYDGRPVPKHVALPGLTDDHFARWLALFAATVDAIATPDSAAILVEYAERIAHSLRLAIAFQRGEDTTRVARLGARAG